MGLAVTFPWDPDQGSTSCALSYLFTAAPQGHLRDVCWVIILRKTLNKLNSQLLYGMLIFFKWHPPNIYFQKCSIRWLIQQALHIGIQSNYVHEEAWRLSVEFMILYSNKKNKAQEDIKLDARISLLSGLSQNQMCP